MQQDYTEDVNTRFSKKIRIFPTTDLKNLFNQFFGASRYIYNKAVKYLNNQYENQKTNYINKAKNGCVYDIIKKLKDGNIETIITRQCRSCLLNKKSWLCEKHKKKKIKWDLDLSFITLRNKIIKKKSEISEDESWLKNIPYDTRQLILKNVIGAFKSAITNLKRGNISKFHINYSTRKNINQFFHAEKRSINIKKLRMFPRKKTTNNGFYKFSMRKKDKKWWRKNIQKISSNFVIKKEKPNKYYICLPLDINKINDEYKKEINRRHPIYSKYNSVFLDPGVRALQTFYSSEGICGKLGYHIINKLERMRKRIDKLKSKMKNKTKETRYNMKQRCNKLRTKIKNIVSDLHWKSASWLCKNFKNIFLPEFGTSKMVKKNTRKINNKTTRNMLTLSHYKFKQKLIQTAKWYKNRNVYIIQEDYTSKTCGNCGYEDNNLKSKEIFKCKECKYKQDRDINAARNMIIKLLKR